VSSENLYTRIQRLLPFANQATLGSLTQAEDSKRKRESDASNDARHKRAKASHGGVAKGHLLNIADAPKSTKSAKDMVGRKQKSKSDGKEEEVKDKEKHIADLRKQLKEAEDGKKKGEKKRKKPEKLSGNKRRSWDKHSQVLSEDN
jgi:hypothetical protein